MRDPATVRWHLDERTGLPGVRLSELVSYAFDMSRSEAKRLIRQGAVWVGHARGVCCEQPGCSCAR